MAKQMMELTPAEQTTIARMRMSASDRAAEQENRKQARLDAMAPEIRQTVEQRNARIAAFTPTERRSYLAAQRLAGLARSLRHEVARGLSLDDAINEIEPSAAADVNWLIDQMNLRMQS